MIEEIVYTSAPKGLKRGSRGFCTVVSTAGMAANMAERLESMSGYRHAFPLNDPQVALNPVNYAYVTTRMAGKKLNILSRVADAGQDYSGRTNKLAHHLVIDDIHALPAGPGRVLADSNTIVSTWDGVVTTRPPRVLRNPASPASVRLTAWQSAEGDSGWAGWVAEQLQSSPAAVHVIFAPGTDTLSLVIEVLDLLPGSQRWDVTFSTYFTRLLAGTECQLRFVLDGTAEATALRNDARARTVDLTQSLPRATGGPLVDKARGEIPLAQTAPVTRPAAASAPTPSTPEIKPYDEAEFGIDEDAASASESPDTYRLRHRTPPTTRGRTPTARPGITFPTHTRQSGKWMYIAIGLVLLCTIGGTGFFLRSEISMLAQGLYERPIAQVDVEQSLEESPGTQPRPQAESRDEKLAANGSEERPKPQEPIDGSSTAMNTPAPNPGPKKPNPKPFEKLEKLSEPKPQRHGPLEVALPGEGKEVLVYVGAPQDLTLEFEGKKVQFQSTNGNPAEAIVDHNGTEIGRFLLEPRTAGEYGLKWTWGKEILTSREALSDAAKAYRFIRGKTVTLKAACEGQLEPHSFPITFKEVEHDPFRYLAGNGRDNSIPDLEVSCDDVTGSQKTSKPFYLDCPSPSNIELSPLIGFNQILTNMNVSVVRKPHGQTESRWAIGFYNKDASQQESEILGHYVAKAVPDDDLTSVSFEWSAPSSNAYLSAAAMAPVTVTVTYEKADKSRIVFPSGGIIGQPVALKQLSKSMRVAIQELKEKPLSTGSGQSLISDTTSLQVSLSMVREPNWNVTNNWKYSQSPSIKDESTQEVFFVSLESEPRVDMKLTPMGQDDLGYFVLSADRRPGEVFGFDLILGLELNRLTSYPATIPYSVRPQDLRYWTVNGEKHSDFQKKNFVGDAGKFLELSRELLAVARQDRAEKPTVDWLLLTPTKRDLKGLHSRFKTWLEALDSDIHPDQKMEIQSTEVSGWVSSQREVLNKLVKRYGENQIMEDHQTVQNVVGIIESAKLTLEVSTKIATGRSDADFVTLFLLRRVPEDAQ